MDLCILIYVFQSKIMYFKLSESKALFCKKLEMNAMRGDWKNTRKFITCAWQQSPKNYLTNNKISIKIFRNHFIQYYISFALKSVTKQNRTIHYALKSCTKINTINPIKIRSIEPDLKMIDMKYEFPFHI